MLCGMQHVRCTTICNNGRFSRNRITSPVMCCCNSKPYAHLLFYSMPFAPQAQAMLCAHASHPMPCIICLASHALPAHALQLTTCSPKASCASHQGPVPSPTPQSSLSGRGKECDQAWGGIRCHRSRHPERMRASPGHSKGIWCAILLIVWQLGGFGAFVDSLGHHLGYIRTLHMALGIVPRLWALLKAIPT